MNDTRENMAEAIEAFGMEDPDNRNIVVICADEKGKFTSSGYAGVEENIVCAIVNEMLKDGNLAMIIYNSAKVYEEVIKEEAKNTHNKDNKNPKYIS